MDAFLCITVLDHCAFFPMHLELAYPLSTICNIKVSNKSCFLPIAVVFKTLYCIINTSSGRSVVII